MPKFASAASSGVFLRALVTVLNDPNVLSMHRWCQRYYTTFQGQCRGVRSAELFCTWQDGVYFQGFGVVTDM